MPSSFSGCSRFAVVGIDDVSTWLSPFCVYTGAGVAQAVRVPYSGPQWPTVLTSTPALDANPCRFGSAQAAMENGYGSAPSRAITLQVKR